MDNDAVVTALARMEAKLDFILNGQADHEARLRTLEQNDLGRIIPFIIGLLTIASLGVALFK